MESTQDAPHKGRALTFTGKAVSPLPSLKENLQYCNPHGKTLKFPKLSRATKWEEVKY